MPVEPPAELRIVVEVRRVRRVRERQAEPLVGRVGLPEPLVAPEVGQPGVDAHPGPCGDDERAGAPELRRRTHVDLSQVHDASGDTGSPGGRGARYPPDGSFFASSMAARACAACSLCGADWITLFQTSTAFFGCFRSFR